MLLKTVQMHFAGQRKYDSSSRRSKTLCVIWQCLSMSSPGGDEDVVHVDKEFCRVLVQKRLKQSTHSLTEGARGVVHPKRHSSRFEQPKRSLEVQPSTGLCL
jgi:hypothetical protein